MKQLKKYVLVLFFCSYTFILYSQPVISSFAPSSGSVGTTVLINGSGFNANPGSNVVYFGAVKANVSVATSTSITVQVPTGAGYNLITVTNNNLTAYSQQPFAAMFNGNGEGFSAKSFAPKVDSSTGSSPGSICAADIDGDGKPDPVVANGSSNTVSVYKNTSIAGSISFAAKINFITGTQPFWVSAGDIDGDGKLDLVIANYSSNTISVLRNTSAGGVISFASKVDFTCGTGPYSLAIGDLNADGKPDIAVANGSANSISVLKNTGSAGSISFAAKIDFTAGNLPAAVAIGDLNADNKPDIAVVNYGSSNMSLFKNTSLSGVISFGSKQDFQTGGSPTGIAIADIDTDSQPDLISSNGSLNTISVLRNTSSTGNFSFAAKMDFVAGPSPQCVYVNDMNGDGRLDIIAGNGGNNLVSVLKNKSTTGNIFFDFYVTYATGSSPISMVLLDLDSDGKPDITTTNISSNTMSVLRNTIIPLTVTSFNPTIAGTGDTIFIKGTNFSLVDAVNFGGVAATYFKIVSDTLIKAVVGNGASGSINIATIYNTASFAGFTYIPPPNIISFSPANAGIGSTVTITGTDFTGATSVYFGEIAASSLVVKAKDTITAVVGNISGGSIKVTTPYGTGSLGGFYNGLTVTSFTPNIGPPGTSVMINGTNFNPSTANNTVYFGAVKAMVSSASNNLLKVTVPTGATFQPITVTTEKQSASTNQPFITTFPNGGTITASSFSQKTDFVTNGRSSWISVSDIDDDGKPDVVVVNIISNDVSIFRNTSINGSVTFAAPVSYSTENSPIGVTIGDLDGDAKPDIVVTADNQGILIFKNNSTNGNILFNKGIYLTTYSEVATICDLDLDGKPDLILSSEGPGFALLRNTTVNGNISFDEPIGYSGPSGAFGTATGDFDGDGKPDVAVANTLDGSISVFHNQSTMGVFMFSQPVTYQAFNRAASIAVGDIDNDGKPDLAVANNNVYGSVSIFKNISTTGNISFASKADLITETAPTSVVLSDIDGDGKIDLTVSSYLVPFNSYQGIVSVFKNNSSIGNISFAPKVDNMIGLGPFHVAVADLQSDAKPEIIAVNFYDNTFSVLKNTIEGTLPIKLLNFNAQIVNNATMLQWKTSNEKDIAYFDIEYSINAINFKTVGTQKGMGNGLATNEYNFLHRAPVAGANYYRLKIVGSDGNISYSSITKVMLGDNMQILNVYPNPAHDYLVVQLPASGNANKQLILTDIIGRVIRTFPVAKDEFQISINLKGISTGIYKIVLHDGSEKQGKTIMIE